MQGLGENFIRHN